MSSVIEESAETISQTDDGAQAKRLIARRSLVMSIVICVIATVLYTVGFAQAGLRGYAPVRLSWSKDFFEFCRQYGFTIPVCLGGLYLTTKVRFGWFLHVSLYLIVYALLAFAFFLAMRIPSNEALDFFSPVAVSFPLVIVITVPVRIFLDDIGLFERMSNEKPVFGISSMLWGSTIVAVLVFLVMWTIEERNELSANAWLQLLVLKGAVYEESTHRLTISANKYDEHPITCSDFLLIDRFKHKLSIEFIDCEITDESIACLKQKRNRFGKIKFVNCKVVKEMSPSGIVKIGNEANEPLPGELPR